MTQATLLQQLARRLDERILEVSAWRDMFREPLSEASFIDRGENEALPVRRGQRWPRPAPKARLRFTVDLPTSWEGQPVWVRLAPGGEGLLLVDGKKVGGLNPYHRDYLVTPQATSPQTIVLEAEVVPRGLFGSPVVEPRLEEALLYVPDPDVCAIHDDLIAAHDAALTFLDEERLDLAAAILEALDRTLASIPLPRAPTREYLARLAWVHATTPPGPGPRAAAQLGALEIERAADPRALPLPEECRRSIPAARESLRRALDLLSTRFGRDGALHLLGHAHIDLAWLWPTDETRRKSTRTFSTVLSLMSDYSELHFCQSSAQIYAWLEVDSHEIFERVRERVAEGRWEVVGGSWVEPDGNLLSGESWSRQLLYGQRYFEHRFGKRAEVAWLPDTFGYAGNLPQLFLQAGMKRFFLTKLSWNDTTTFPHDLYWWEGLDGSRVLAHSFRAPDGYNGRINPGHLRAVWRSFRGKSRHPVSLYTFGYGDGGGGPSAQMLERIERFRSFPGLPRLETGSAQAYFDQVPTAGLPVWVGEQYLEFHRGTYTAQAELKALHRRLEHRLVEAEAAESLRHFELGHDYPQDKLQRAWTTLLRNQFHDILPGSSILEVNERARNELRQTLAEATKLRDDALDRLAGEVDPGHGADLVVVVWNLDLGERPLRVVAERPVSGPFRLASADGAPITHQALEDGRILIASDSAKVPGLGYLALALERTDTESPARTGGASAAPGALENEYLRVELSPDGTLASIFDKEAQREVLSDRGNQLWIHTDIPGSWEAWEVDRDYANEGHELTARGTAEIVEHGPLRAAQKVVRQAEGLLLEQTYRITAGSRRLDIETRLVCGGRRRMLRALFPVAVRSHEARFETSFGAVPRPTHANRPHDGAQFEVPAHRWVDLREPGYGVSLLNDGKYGHSVRGNVLGLTLLRAPIYPDPVADEGEHRFTYALLPHDGASDALTLREAQDLNAPLCVSIAGSTSKQWPPSRCFLSATPEHLRLACLKKSEDGDELVLRVYEPSGRRCASIVQTDPPLETCTRIGLLEKEREVLEVDSDGLALSTRPFEVTTVSLTRRV